MQYSFNIKTFEERERERERERESCIMGRYSVDRLGRNVQLPILPDRRFGSFKKRFGIHERNIDVHKKVRKNSTNF